jgi:hypothetical protein
MISSLDPRTFGKLAVLFFAVSILGCGDSGPALSPVKGKITKGGKPLASVGITFTPLEGGLSSAGLTDAEGNFVLVSSAGRAGAVVGKHRAVLSAKPAEAAGPVGYDAMMKARQSTMSNSNQGAPIAEKASDLFPPEYSDATRSPLDYEVKAGDNVFDIVIP